MIPQLAENLKSQNDELVDIRKGIDGINASFVKFFQNENRNRLDDLEKERDAKAEKRKEETKERTVSAGTKKSGAGFGLGFGAGGLFGRVGAGAAGFAGALGLTALLRGAGGITGRLGLFGIGQLLADEIGKEIADYTGSIDLGASTSNAIRFGAIGALFGKKFGLIGGALGALATEENMQTLENIGKSLKEHGLNIKQGLDKMGITIPSAAETFDNVSRLSSKFLKAIEKTVDVDFGVSENREVDAIQMGLTTTAEQMAKNSSTSKKLSVAAKNQMDRIDRFRRQKQGLDRIRFTNMFNNLSKTQQQSILDKGFIKASDGSLRRLDGKFPSEKELVKIADEAGVGNMSKSPFLKALKAVPFLGGSLAFSQIASIESNPELSDEEKAEQIGSVLAQLGGGQLGAISALALGGKVASRFPKTAVIIGFAGGVGGSLLGDKLMGDQIASLILNYKQASPIGQYSDIGTAGYRGGQGLMGLMIKDKTTELDALNTNFGGAPMAVMGDTISSSNQTVTNFSSFDIGTTDNNNQFYGSR